MRLFLLIAGLVLVAGCGGNRGAAPSSSAGTVRGTVKVFAAASLTEAFTTIAHDFERAHPGTTVSLNFGASSSLAQQIVSGAPADVFAAASPATMKTVIDGGGAADSEVFARNSLQIAVPPSNPGHVSGLADFANAPLKIALCAEQVPCGAAAEKVFTAAGITPRPDTLEQDVKAVLSKVELGEVDAGLVYKTDVLAAAKKVKGLPCPESSNAVTAYPIAALTSAANAAGAAAFAAYVRSEEGQKVLAAAGFDSP